jgi:acetyl-CoA synthetase
VDRHAAGPRRDHVALRWLGKKGEIREFTYGELARRSDLFAGVLRDLGVVERDRVFAMTGRIPELFIAALGTWKNGSVFCPLFSAFGPEPIRQRLSLGEAKVLVTTAALYEKKLASLRDALPRLEHVILVGAEPGSSHEPGLHDFQASMERARGGRPIAVTAPEDVALLHFTSGTTGTPKAAIHVHDAVVVHNATGRLALDFHPDDVFWCTADPGWVTGTSYGIIAPLTAGITSIVDEAEFDAERWYRILQDQKVTVWYSAPTAIRMLMKFGAELPRRFDLTHLRFAGSVGEPLNPEAVVWGEEALGLPIHDNWWQTETGGIMIANYAACDIKPGSMGRPLPGIDAAILECDEEGNVRLVEGKVKVVKEPEAEGMLALRAGWPSMFRGYLNELERYRKCFADGWYLTGDLARKDADGYFWFVARVDDVIKSSGHLIGPFEVESVLLAHPAVAEAGVIGKPDPVAGEIVKAFVALKPGRTASEDLRLELLGFARQRLGAVVAPKEFDFVERVPKTKSGKIMRRLLKARELGLAEGDTSTLETE